VPNEAADTLRVALLHLAPEPGDVVGNQQAVERGLMEAAEAGAQWVLTPELVTSGYTFAEQEGTGWISPQPDPWVKSLLSILAESGQTLFLGLPERDPDTGALHNTLLVLGPEGVLGRHRKVLTLNSGSEAWSSPGDDAVPVEVAPMGPVGLLVCADACEPTLARTLADQGARILLSAANWAPDQYGPAVQWERATLDTGLPLIVCNRTGPGRNLDFREAQSAVIVDGQRIFEHASPEPALVLLDWDLNSGWLAREPQIAAL
jgi:predicted amidohydrolase